MATHITEAHIEVIEKIDVPVIIVGQEHDRLYSIYHDDYEAGYKIGVLIGEKGCRNVHFFGVSEEDIAVGIQRKLGVIQALKDYHISPKIYETTFKHEQAFKDVSQQLERVRDADAIVEQLIPLLLQSINIALIINKGFTIVQYMDLVETL